MGLLHPHIARAVHGCSLFYPRHHPDPRQVRLALIDLWPASDVGSHRLEEFLKELPTVIRRAEPNLTSLLGESVPLARLLKLRELQTSFVYSTVLAKKTKVGPLPALIHLFK